MGDKLTMTLEVEGKLRVNVLDGEPTLEVLDSLGDAQECGDPWDVVAQGREDVLALLRRLIAFVEDHSDESGAG